ncbi:hypothetical protein XPA_002199 [Xanthoria parietina]
MPEGVNHYDHCAPSYIITSPSIAPSQDSVRRRHNLLNHNTTGTSTVISRSSDYSFTTQELAFPLLPQGSAWDTLSNAIIIIPFCESSPQSVH